MTIEQINWFENYSLTGNQTKYKNKNSFDQTQIGYQNIDNLQY